MECSSGFIICYICKCGCHVDVCCFRAIINWINYANESCSTIYYFRFTYGNLITFTFGFLSYIIRSISRFYGCAIIVGCFNKGSKHDIVIVAKSRMCTVNMAVFLSFVYYDIARCVFNRT